jgi:hypothetical protein
LLFIALLYTSQILIDSTPLCAKGGVAIGDAKQGMKHDQEDWIATYSR